MSSCTRLIALALAATLSVLRASPAQTYNEQGDANHQGPALADPCYSGASLNLIVGTFNGNDPADAYIVRYPASNVPLVASTRGLSAIDTQLFLFHMDGTGIVSNDNAVDIPNVTGATLSASSLAPGYYILVVAPRNNEPIDELGNLIFQDETLGLNPPVNGQRIWTDFTRNSLPTGNYSINVSNVTTVSTRGPRTVLAQPQTTIDAAIASLQFGDTLLLPEGEVYLSAPITIAPRAKAITIRGSGQRGTSIIKPATPGAAFPAIFLNATHEGPLTRFENIVFEGFTAPVGSGGAAARLIESSPSFVGCIFRTNTSPGDAGAVLLFDSSATFDRCEFASNQSAAFGGAAYLGGNTAFNTTATFRNCLFHSNAALRGSAIAAQSVRARLINATITANASPDGAVFANFSGQLDIDGSIIHGNTNGPDLNVDTNTAASIQMHRTVAPASSPGFASGDANLDASPRFLDPAQQDFRLAADSPAVDVDPATAALARLGPQDLEGGPRVVDNRAAPGTPSFILDRGALETHAGAGAGSAAPTQCPGDADGDGTVRFLDITTVLANFGIACP
jgi:hypothetical protein